MKFYKVIVGDNLLTPGSIDEVGYYSNYDKAFKALKKDLKTWGQKINFIPNLADTVKGYQGEWIDLKDNTKGIFEIRQIEIN